jgi:hypothetical protein
MINFLKVPVTTFSKKCHESLSINIHKISRELKKQEKSSKACLSGNVLMQAHTMSILPPPL